MSSAGGASDRVRVLSEHSSVFSQWIAEIRDVELQRDRMRFRRNVERMGEILAYEISKELEYETTGVETPLGTAVCQLLRVQPVLVSILRAGVTLHHGLLNYFDRAENAFISAYRKHHGESDTFDVEMSYIASPSVEGKTVIMCDPMLATASSMVLAYRALLERGTPAKVHVACLIASRQGVDFALKHFPPNTTLWIGAVDPELTPRAYIVPGLGDAGDLAYGPKE